MKMTDLENRLNRDYPDTSAVILNNADEVIYSGNMADANEKWDTLPFDAPHGLYQIAYAGITGNWYRVNWMKF